MDIQAFIQGNEHLRKFEWTGKVVNHTKKPRLGRRYDYPDYDDFVPKGQGIYVFFDSKQKCLYVGQARGKRMLVNRLKDRFKEMHGQGHKDYPDHTQFFQTYQDQNMLILTTCVLDPFERNQVEKYLTIHLNPLFLEFQKVYQKKRVKEKADDSFST
ncbi:GIY-YIG nuclease family protein [Aneurinibacillus sp. BA2021]|nr:GIY-YIG nuclease family protein [Aneurinibacillus sp. BA2021]